MNKPVEGSEPEFRSGFVSLTGRPNVGKSTLLNNIVGEKVTIVSNKAQTTRNDIRGVLTDGLFQIVFVDTPGISKPRSELGKKLNSSAYSVSSDVDLVCFVVDANSGFGTGDKFIAQHLDPENTICVLNKIDGVKPDRIMKQLGDLGEFGFSSYFPVSAWDGTGVKNLVSHLQSRLPVGPEWFPQEMITDRDQGFRVAELVREQLLRITEQELPHSIATQLVAWDWPRVRVDIIVERDSQKGIVIGKNGEILKRVGTAVRRQMKPGAYLELIVKVKKNWQQNAETVTELGY